MVGWPSTASGKRDSPRGTFAPPQPDAPNTSAAIASGASASGLRMVRNLGRWPPMNRRAFMQAAAAGLASLAVRRSPAGAADGELLYNGIRLPRVWPPSLRSFSRTQITPPYLLDPPAVISIDVGRQLFVDDFLIERTTLTRTFHHATYHRDNPLLRPVTAWEELDAYADRTGTGSSPTAMVFSDGVFYDPKDRLYKLWYMAGYSAHTSCAVSSDGLEWTRPAYDVKADTNIVLTGVYRDSNTIWLDHDEIDPSLRFK